MISFRKDTMEFEIKKSLDGGRNMYSIGIETGFTNYQPFMTILDPTGDRIAITLCDAKYFIPDAETYRQFTLEEYENFVNWIYKTVPGMQLTYYQLLVSMWNVLNPEKIIEINLVPTVDYRQLADTYALDYLANAIENICNENDIDFMFAFSEGDPCKIIATKLLDMSSELKKNGAFK